MIRNMGLPQWIGAGGVITAFAYMTRNFIQGKIVSATIILVLLVVLFGLLLWWCWPSRGAHISHAAAQGAAGEGTVIVYWRPGCMYCDRLKLGLGSARSDISWVNVLKDPDAARYLANFYDGNSVVPTVVTGDGELIDPTPAAIKAQLAGAGIAS